MITKEMIEKEVGYEINNFELEPLYKDTKCIGLNVKIEPKKVLEFINNTITIGKSDDFNVNSNNEYLTNTIIQDDTTEFIKYCKEERNNFVRKFWEICGNNIEARVMAEDLLIAYDQLIQRVSSHEC